MTEQMMTLIDTILSSTARTVRAAVLILVLAVATGTAPALHLPVAEPPSAPADAGSSPPAPPLTRARP